jgi:hypothetical protein
VRRNLPRTHEFVCSVLAVALLAACVNGGSSRNAAPPPAPPPAAATTGGSPTGLDLGAIALAPADVGDVAVEAEGPIEAPPRATASVHRVLAAGGRRVGASTFELLESTVTEFEDDGEAAAFLGAVDEGLSPEFLSAAVERTAGLEPEGLESDRVELQLGDQSVVQWSRFDAAAGGSFEAAFLFARVGRLVQALFAIARAGSLDVADAAGLAGAVAARMRAAQADAS